MKAEAEARMKAEEEARIQAQLEAQRKAEEEARLAAEREARKRAEEARMAEAYEARRAEEGRMAEDRARMAAEKEAKMRAEMDRIAAEKARLAAEKEAKREAEEARVTAEIERAAAEKVKVRIVSAFEFMVLKRDKSSISQDSQVPRFFYHPKYNPYSPDFRAELASRLANFTPCVGYEIISISGNKVVCNLKKRGDNGYVSVYQLVLEHDGGMLNVTSFDIAKANRIQ